MTGVSPTGPGSCPTGEAAGASSAEPAIPNAFEWRKQTEKYAHGEDLFVAGIRLGSAFYDGTSSRTIADRQVIETRLPGLRPRVTRFARQEEAKAALERFTLAWFNRMLSPPTE